MENGGIVVTWQTIIMLAAVLGAIFAILRYYNKGYDWVRKQKKQDADIKSIKEEQQLLTYAVAACLKGLKELGCDGVVTDAITKLDKHLNEKAHV